MIVLKGELRIKRAAISVSPTFIQEQTSCSLSIAFSLAVLP